MLLRVRRLHSYLSFGVFSPLAMVKFGLQVTAVTCDISELWVDSDYEWNLKLQCTSCNERDDNWHGISEAETVQGKGGPGSFNFQMKCKFCSSVFTIDIVKGSVKRVKGSENGLTDKQTIVVFDCRGVEPVEFDPQGPWTAKNSSTGTTFSDIDLSEDSMWAGYDQRSKTPVSIEEFKAHFVRV